MIKQAVFSLVIVGFGFFILSIMFNPIATKVNALRTDPQTDTPLACTTSSVETSCVVLLSEKSAYEPVSPNWEVLQIFPTSANKTSSSVLAADLQSVTVSGLSISTDYEFTVDYFIVNPSVADATSLNSILKRFNLLLVIGLLIILVVGTGLSFNVSNRRFG